MKFKKWATTLVATVLSAVLLAGCSGNTGGTGAEAAGSEAEGKQTLHVLMEVVPDTDFVTAQLDKFTEETGIEVVIEAINYANMHEKLLAQMLSKTNSYDVIVVDCYWVAEFVQAGWLEELDGYVQRDNVDLGVYVPTMLDMVGQVEGKTYMLPFYNYMLSLVYRTDVMEAENLTIPDNMEDYVEMCKALTAKNGDTLNGAVMQGLRPDPIAMEWLNYFFSCGGDFYDVDGKPNVNSPEGVKALELYVDNMQNAAPKGAAGYGFDEAFNVFAQGNAATYITYNWMLPKLDNPDESNVAGKVALADVPGGVSLNAGWGWAIPKNAPDKEASWKFLKWVESFDTAKARALSGGCPTRTDVMEDSDVLAVYPHYTDVARIMSSSKMIPIIADAPQLIEVLGRELSEAVSGNKTPQEALDIVNEELANMH